MKKGNFIIYGILIGILAFSAVIFIFPNFRKSLVSNPGIENTTENTPTAKPFVATEEILFEGAQWDLITYPQRSSENRFYFIDRNTNSLFRYDILTKKSTKLVSEENTDGSNQITGVVIDRPDQLLYETGNDLNRKLKYKIKDQPPTILIHFCSLSNLSPDQTKLIISGNLPDDPNAEKNKLYLIDLTNFQPVEIIEPDGSQDWGDNFIKFAVWSGDNCHYLTGDQIVDTETREFKNSIRQEDEFVSDCSWSPDGKRLVFTVQKLAEERYRKDLEFSTSYLSNKLGIYNVGDNSIQYFICNDYLISNFLWKDNQHLILSTVPLEFCEENKKNFDREEYSKNFVDIKTLELRDLTVTDLLSSYQVGESEPTKPKVVGINQAYGDFLFIHRVVNTDKTGACLYHPKTGTVIDFVDDYPDIYTHKTRRFIVKNDGLFSLDERNLTLTKLVSYKLNTYSHLFFPDPLVLIFQEREEGENGAKPGIKAVYFNVE